TPVPLNYNFHGMAHSAAVTGGADEYSPTPTNDMADQPRGYRGISDRGLIFDPLNTHSVGYYSGQLMGANLLQYGFFSTLGYATPTAPDAALNGLDIIHLGSRCAGFGLSSIYAYESTANTATNIGIAPAWNICNQTTPQATTFAPVAIGANTLVGILYQ